MKSLTRQLLFFCSWTMLLPFSMAQTTDYEKKLDHLLYNTNSYIVSYSQCLSNMYATVVKNQKVNRYGNNGCNHETPWDEEMMKDSLFYAAVNQKNPEIATALNRLNEICKQVVIDLKLERLSEPKLSEHFVKFESACKLLNDNSEALREKWRTAALRLLPKDLAAYLDNDYQTFKTLRHNLRPNLNSEFPEALLRQNLKKSDSLIVLLEQKATQDANLRNLMYAIKGAQDNKKYFLNELVLKNRMSTSYRNDFFYQIHNQYNNSLLQMLRHPYNNPYSFYIPFLPADNKTSDQAKMPEFQFKAVNEDRFNGAINHWNFKDADAIGELTTALNEAVRKTNNTTDAVYRIYEEMQRKISGQSKSAILLLHDFSMNEGDIEGALGRLKLNSNEAFPTITKQTDNVLKILKDIRVLYESIGLLLQGDKNQQMQNFPAVEALMEQYRKLLLEFEKQLLVLNANMNKANTPKLNAQDNWSKTARALESYCQELKVEIEVMEDRAIDKKSGPAYDFTKIEQQYAKLLEQEIPMMTGIKKLGSGHGLCPYGIFEDVLENGLVQQRKVLPFKDSMNVPYSKNCCDGYSRMIDAYNDALSYYNKFSLQGAERETDFAKYDHPTPVVNNVLLYKPTLLPEMKLPPPPPPKKDPEPVEEPKKPEPQPIVQLEMTKEYVQQCKPNNILFLIDISSSMQSKDKLQHFKADLMQIASLMRKEDVISIVTFEGKAVLELKQTSVLDQEKWEKTIEKLKSSGGTRFDDGLATAYEYMQKIADAKYNNRIVLISDGEFAVSDASIATAKSAAAAQNISFSALIYSAHAHLYPRVFELASQSKGNYSMITEKENGVPILFTEFAVLK